MANVLNDLTNDIFVAADVVSRELTGFIPAVTLNADGSERVAIGGLVRSAVTRAATVGNRNVGMTVSEGTDQTVDNKTAAITKDRSVEIPWTGENIRFLNNGPGFETVYGDQLAQAMRSLANEMEADLAVAAYQGASRAYGTAGTTPFGTAGDFTDGSEILRILKDNGAPNSDNQLVVNTAAGAKFIGLQGRYNVTGAQADSIRSQGVLVPLAGMDIRESAQVVTPTSGTAVNTTVTGVNAVGTTSIGVTTAAGGSVSLSAGDIITIAGDANKYVVASALSLGASTTGTLVISAPGLRKATAGAESISVVATSARNVGFARSAIELIARAPSSPVINGVVRDSAIDRMMVVDPRSGMPFEVAVYVGQGKAMIQVAVAWGVKVWKNEHVATLLG